MQYLRCLVYMNPLVVDKIGKSFLFWKDSGFIFTKNLISSLPASWRFYWLVPPGVTTSQYAPWFEANQNVELIPYPYSTGIHQNRYEFYGETLRQNFSYADDVDLIITNQPEVAASLKTWAANQRRDKPIIASYYQWIDCEESRAFSKELGGFNIRQVEGFLNSDLAYFHNEYAVSLFRREWESIFKIPMPDEKVRYFHPPATSFGNNPIELGDKKIILFNHRLNNTTGWRTALDACAELKRNDFVLWFTDEQNLKVGRELKEYPFVKVQAIPTEHYGYAMNRSHFALCCHKGYSTWNMAVMDSLNAGCFTLLPRERPYTEMVLGDRFFHNYDDVTEKMNELLDMPAKELQALAVLEKAGAPCFAEPKTNLETEVDLLIKSEIKGSPPAKYEMVRDMVRQEETPKRDWVNAFWSFHVNSNFRKIRLRLLQEGITDDTTRHNTVYRSC